jgi:hypothetical protein
MISGTTPGVTNLHHGRIVERSCTFGHAPACSPFSSISKACDLRSAIRTVRPRNTMGLEAWKLHEKTSRFQLEIYNYAGVILGAIAYGACFTHVYLGRRIDRSELAGLTIATYFATIISIWQAARRKYAWFFTVASTLLFVCATLNLIANALAMQWTYINYRGYPGGPALFIEQVSSSLPVCKASSDEREGG